MPTTTPRPAPTQPLLATTSGAKLAPISTDAAEAFLARVGQRGPETTEIALGALGDDMRLIGVAVLGAGGDSRSSSATVAVTPERRRLQIGSDLLHALLGAAARRGVRRVSATYPVGATGAEALVRSVGLPTARRVVNGQVTAVILVSDS